MSQYLLGCLRPNHQPHEIQRSLDVALESIESEHVAPASLSHSPAADSDTTRLNGPFGVFSSHLPLLQPDTPDSLPPNSIFPHEDDGSVAEPSSMLSPPSFETPDTSSLTDESIKEAETRFMPAESAISLLFAAAGSILDASVESSVESPGLDHTDTRPPPSNLQELPDEASIHPGITLAELQAPYVSTEARPRASPSNGAQATSGFTSAGHHYQQPVWQPISPPIDNATAAEFKMLLLHFDSHLAGLLSPCPLTIQSVRGQSCADAALLCYGRLSLLGDATTDACALLYSLLGMSAAHMDSVYGTPPSERVGEAILCSPNHPDHIRSSSSGTYRSSALRLIHLAKVMLESTFDTSLSKEAAKRILTSLLNLFSTRVSLKARIFHPQKQWSANSSAGNFNTRLSAI